MAQITWSINAVDRTRAAFASVRQNLRGMQKDTDALGKRMMAGIIQGGAFALLGREVREVAAGINEIPGIPEDTRQSVREMNQTLTDARNTMRGLTADMMGGFATGAKSLGSTLGAMDWGKFLNPMTTAVALGEAQATVAAALEGETQKYIAALHAQTDAEKAQAAATKAAKDAMEKKNAVLKAGREGADAALRQMESQRKMSADYHRALRDEGETIRKEVLTPGEAYAEQLDRLNLLRDASAVSVDVYHRKLRALQETAVSGELEGFFGDMDKKSFERISGLTREAKEASKAAKELGWAFASSFEDAVLEGGKLSDVLRGLAKDVARIFLRNAITDPLARSLSGVFGGFSLFGGSASTPPARAAGGPVSSGTTYLVGENGPELFTAPASGHIVPNHELSGGGGASVYNFNYHFPMGVTKAELMPALEATKRATIAAIQDMRARSAGRASYA